MDIVRDAFVEHRVGCVGIGPGLVGRFGHPLILDNGSVLFLVAFAPFQPIEEGSRDIVLPGFLGIDVAEGADLAEDESPAFDAMDDGETADFESCFVEEDVGLVRLRLAEGM